MGNVRTYVYAKFRCAALLMKKALGIFRELIPRRRRRRRRRRTTATTTRVAFGDLPSGSKKTQFDVFCRLIV